ncbi:MAG: hypothetical protein HY812_07120 [Planctomycetes bacterium]|nr:hypothetical protein [Planctomycetota bacterium]
MSRSTFGSLATAVLMAALGQAAFAAGGKLDVIHTEIPGHPTAVVPGCLDAAGNPVTAYFTALADLNINNDGSEWVVKGYYSLVSTTDSIMVKGSGLAGTTFCQEDQPFLGGVAGEKYDFFDTLNPVSWDDAGNIGFSARAKGGATSIDEKVVYFDGTTHTVPFAESSPLFGVTDIPANPSGDETFGSSIASVQLRNDGTIWVGNTPINNCSSFRYPGIFINQTVFRHCGFSTIGVEVWDDLPYADSGCSPDGAHWFAEGDTENPNTAIDKILAVDDAIVLQEGSPVAGSTMTMTDIFNTFMISNGDWFSRGDDPSDNDWAVRNSVLIAKTGDPITTGSAELWGASFYTFTGNKVGDWVIAGSTNQTDVNLDSVVVVSDQLVMRESDPVDLDGNGLFDDDTYIRSFIANAIRMTDDRVLYMLVTLKNLAGTSLGDAFIRLTLCGDITNYGAGCPGTGGLVPSLTYAGCAHTGETVTVDIQNGLPSSLAILFFGLSQVSIPMHGSCYALVYPLPGFIALPLDGTGALSIGGTMPASAAGFTFTSQAFVADGGVPHGYSNTNGVEVSVN